MSLTVTPAAYDVVVIGGGPAGAAAAALLQRQGHRAVMSKYSIPAHHIGRSLIPHTYGTLDRLGLLPKLRASHFPVKHSVPICFAIG
ncbi:MAG: tryptophan 7-halogenase [Pirellulaceae bacterium]